MTDSVQYPIIGSGALQRFLDERDEDVRYLEPAAFRGWLQRHLDRWSNDPIFVQRSRIRNLGREHPELARLEREYRQASTADAASPHSARLHELERALIGTGKAVTGLTGALAAAAPSRRIELREKLDRFLSRQQRLLDEREALTERSAERQAVHRARSALEALRSTIGMDREAARLEELLQQRGHRSNRTGEAFEQQALALTQRHLLPTISADGGGAAGEYRVLTGVGLGAARTEFDQVVVRFHGRSDQPVEVLAVVEAKRNINDVAHGFRLRQENLAWLTGDTAGYNAGEYRTRRFDTGHFDGRADHRQEDDNFVFASESFRRFVRDPTSGWFLERLWIVTREGPLWGLGSPALGRLGFRAATDTAWDPDSEAYLGELLRWCRSLAHPIEAPDVIRMYAASAPAAASFLVVR